MSIVNKRGKISVVGSGNSEDTKKGGEVSFACIVDDNTSTIKMRKNHLRFVLQKEMVWKKGENVFESCYEAKERDSLALTMTDIIQQD